MNKQFKIPKAYESHIAKAIKDNYQAIDPKKRDINPALLNFGPVRFIIPRHFGFCFGVENAIDIAYRTIEEHPDKNIYLLSEMIHNPAVNEDLENRGVAFLFETNGTEIIPLESLHSDDIVLIPAFGTTIEIQKKLEKQGINPYKYDTTCPFVVKVWNRGKKLGEKGYSLIIHGKHEHEETRATFSHSSEKAPCVVVLNPDEAQILADIFLEKRPLKDFETFFGKKSTPGFNPLKDLEYCGVINQTTMLATETKEVMSIIQKAMLKKFGESRITMHFANTADTLCYATNENQAATQKLLEQDADIALVVGGYNSSNTMHLVELLEKRFPTYHIRDASEIKSNREIHHFNQWKKKEVLSKNWIPVNPDPLTVILTSGASCPDILVDQALLKILAFFDECLSVEEALTPFLPG